MLSEFAQAVLKNNRIDEDNVVDVDANLVVTFKDGSKQQIVESYSRVMGYLRSKSEYNVGKRQEHADRTLFVEPTEDCSCGCK